MTNETNTADTFLFSFRGIELRAFRIDGEPWFLAKDACDLLGLSHPVAPHLRKLADDQKAKAPSSFPGTRGPRANIISESGLYRLIFRSDKPIAKEFQDWVVGEVLPSIEAHGGYVDGQEKMKTGEMGSEEYLARVDMSLARKIERIEAEKAAAGTGPTAH